MTYPRGGSEYGGFPGLIQPEPHDIRTSAAEQLMLAQMTDPADVESSVESVADDIRAQGKKDGAKQNG